MSIPMRGALDGTARIDTSPVQTGKRTTAALETGIGSEIEIDLSCLEVRRLRIGGCMMGTSAI
jgi:hypothetical protein